MGLIHLLESTHQKWASNHCCKTCSPPPAKIVVSIKWLGQNSWVLWRVHQYEQNKIFNVASGISSSFSFISFSHHKECNGRKPFVWMQVFVHGSIVSYQPATQNFGPTSCTDMRRDLKKERCFRSHCKNALKLDIYLINLQNEKWLWIKVVPFLTYEVPPAGRQTWWTGNPPWLIEKGLGYRISYFTKLPNQGKIFCQYEFFEETVNWLWLKWKSFHDNKPTIVICLVTIISVAVSVPNIPCYGHYTSRVTSRKVRMASSHSSKEHR